MDPTPKKTPKQVAQSGGEVAFNYKEFKRGPFIVEPSKMNEVNLAAFNKNLRMSNNHLLYALL